MISVFVLQRVAVTCGKFYKSCFRTISKSSSNNSVEINVAIENDMVSILKYIDSIENLT